MTPREQIVATVDEMIKSGRIDAGMKEQYITLLAGNDNLANDFGGMLMRGADYTRKTMTAAEERRQREAEFAAKEQQLAAERQQLKQWQTQAEAEINRLRAIEHATPQIAAKLAAMETTLRNYNLLDSVEVPKLDLPSAQPFQSAQQPSTPSNPQNDYLTREQVASFANDLLRQQALAFTINNRHQQLFGEPLMEDVIGTALRSGQDPEAYWKTKYGVDLKLAQLEETKKANERAQIRAEVEAEILNKYAMDPGRVLGNAPAQQASAFAEAYMSSKALEYAPVNTDGQRKAPEQLSDVQATRSRLQEASRVFNSEFAPDGSPLQRGGPAV